MLPPLSSVECIISLPLSCRRPRLFLQLKLYPVQLDIYGVQLDIYGVQLDIH